jgi:hypothetical protein
MCAISIKKLSKERPEQQFYRKLRDRLSTWKFTRIENIVSVGIPDSFVIVKDENMQEISFFAEFKALPFLHVTLRPTQVIWGKEGVTRHCPTAVINRDPATNIFQIWLWPWLKVSEKGEIISPPDFQCPWAELKKLTPVTDSYAYLLGFKNTEN